MLRVKEPPLMCDCSSVSRLKTGSKVAAGARRQLLFPTYAPASNGKSRQACVRCPPRYSPESDSGHLRHRNPAESCVLILNQINSCIKDSKSAYCTTCDLSFSATSQLLDSPRRPSTVKQDAVPLLRTGKEQQKCPSPWQFSRPCIGCAPSSSRTWHLPPGLLVLERIFFPSSRLPTSAIASRTSFARRT